MNRTYLIAFIISTLLFTTTHTLYGQIIKKKSGSYVDYLSDSAEKKHKFHTSAFYKCTDNTFDTTDLAVMLLQRKYRNDTKNPKLDKAYKEIDSIVNTKHRTDTIIFVANENILADDSDFYTYRVWKDDQLLFDWKKMRFFVLDSVQGHWYELARGELPGHEYVVDIKDRYGNNFEHMTYASNYPAISLWGVYTGNEKNAVKQYLRNFKKIDSSNLPHLPQVAWTKYNAIGPFDTFSYKNGKLVLPASLSIPSSYNDLLFLMGDIPDSIAYEYRLVDENDNNSIVSGWQNSDSWINNGKGNNLIEIKNIKPGNYSIRISLSKIRDEESDPITKILTNNELIYRITIRPQWYQTTWFGVIAGMLSGSLVVLIIFMIYRDRQRSRQKQKDLLHRMGVLQLQSYRAQLNPHFVFNALSSIQSLINKDDAAMANQYLTDFSSLLRITLDQHKAEFWTLQDETDMLTKYIGLEQLRFRFHYNLHIDSAIHAIDISFPSMLLQPVVENAIKHGISAKTTDGQLIIDIRASKKDLIITIKDNGAGFTTDATHTGIHGISLTQQRIAFLNETNSNQRIELNIQSSDAGTNATFYLYDYL